MKSIVKGKVEVKFYDSADEMPIVRFQEFNRFLMIANEIGSTFADSDKRMEKALQFFQSGMNKEGMQELINRRNTIYNCFEGYSPKNKALALLAYSIDGIKCGISGSDVEDTIQKLNNLGLNESESIEIVEESKKK